MTKDKQPNPITERLTRNTGGPSKRFLRWLSIGIGTAAVVAVMIILATVPEFVVLSLLLTGAVVAISPAVLALYAANLTANDLRGENLQMLKLAGITENTMLYGYVNAAAHRMRLFIAVATALTPAMVLSGGFTLVGSVARPAGFDISPLAIISVLVIITPLMAVVSTGMWFFQKLGGGLGALLAVWWKRPLPAMAVSSLAMLIMMPVVFYTTGWILTFMSLIIIPLLVAIF